MKFEEARKVLSSCHPEDLKSPDPLIREALAMAAEYPELQELLSRQKEVDGRIAAALAETPVPEDLRDRLLGSVAGHQQKSRSRIVRLSWTFGIAAMLVIGVGTVFLSKNEKMIRDIQRTVSGKDHEFFESYREGMAYYISSVYFQLDHLSDSLSSIENWLEEKDTPAYDELPDQLVALNPIGCKEIAWRDRKVSLVCFHTERGKIIHLFIMDTPGPEDEAYDNISRVAVAHGLETGGWTSGEKVYLLVGSDETVDIEFALG